MYNGERYLAETVRSILAQTYTDFELLISDNASSDGTAEVARVLVREDRRVRYFRNDLNIGAERNYNRCVELANGDYYWGIGYDDLAHPRYLERCVAALDADPVLVLCHSRVYRIDATGTIIGEYEGHAYSSSPRPHERFLDALFGPKWTIACHGVLRLSTLRKAAPLIPHPTADSNRQAELALLGRILEIPEFLFFHRVHPAPAGARDRMKWSEPKKAGTIIFPHWRRLGELFRSVARTPLGIVEGCLCYLQIGRYLLTRRMAVQLPRDVKNATIKFLSRHGGLRGPSKPSRRAENR